MIKLCTFNPKILAHRVVLLIILKIGLRASARNRFENRKGATSHSHQSSHVFYYYSGLFFQE